jgi:hypothetical protein
VVLLFKVGVGSAKAERILAAAVAFPPPPACRLQFCGGRQFLNLAPTALPSLLDNAMVGLMAIRRVSADP